MNTAADIFYTAADVMQIIGCKKSKAYSIIVSLNKELEDLGYMTIPGKVSKRRLHERYYIDQEPAKAQAKRSTSKPIQREATA